MLRSRELLLFLQRRVLPPMDIHAISRLISLPGTNLALLKGAFLKEAEGMGSSKM